MLANLFDRSDRSVSARRYGHWQTLAVMIVPYPPGIPLIMPGERITAATKSIQDYLVYARAFDRKFPGFETDIHGLRFTHNDGGRRYLVDCIVEERRHDPA